MISCFWKLVLQVFKKGGIVKSRSYVLMTGIVPVFNEKEQSNGLTFLGIFGILIYFSFVFEMVNTRVLSKLLYVIN